MNTDVVNTDVVIVGGGPGGATAALFLAQHGLRSVIVEKDRFPRFHIGESMTGEAGAILRRLGLEETMTKRSYPVKFATEVYGTGGKNKFRVPVMSRNDDRLDVASTWQVRRSDFDAILLETALGRGAELIAGSAGEPVEDPSGRISGVIVETPDGTTRKLNGRMVVDASGRGTWAYRAGLTGGRDRGNYDSQTAIFSHVARAERDPGDDSGNTLIFYKDHLHWGWFIPIDDEVTSVGIVAPNRYVKAFEGSVEEYWHSELRTLNPELARRVEDAERTEPVRSTANFSYDIEGYGGNGFLSIGDAHRFIDPIFSFGLYITMAEAERAALSIAQHLDGGNGKALDDHVRFADRGQNTLQTLVDGFWTNPLAFGYMVHHSEYSEEFIDLFAGRIYAPEPSRTVRKLEQLIAAA